MYLRQRHRKTADLQVTRGLTDSDPQAALSQVPFPAPSPVLTVHPFPCTTQPAPPLPAAPKPEAPEGTVASQPSPLGPYLYPARCALPPAGGVGVSLPLEATF